MIRGENALGAVRPNMETKERPVAGLQMRKNKISGMVIWQNLYLLQLAPLP